MLEIRERAAYADLPNLLRQLVDYPDDKYYLVVIGKREEGRSTSPVARLSRDDAPGLRKTRHRHKIIINRES